MPQLRLTVQSMTPLLMYGADNKDDRQNTSLRAEPELRASSIRGMLRYWLRAVLGAKIPFTGQVFEAESAILGSTETGSRIQVRVQQGRSMRSESDQYVMPKHKDGIPLKHTAFVPGSEFRITLSTHPLYSGNVLAPEGDLLKAVFLMVHFSGLGRRARRGSGNLRVLEAKGYEGNPPLAVLPDDRGNLKAYLVDVAQFVSPAASVSIPPEFPVFAPNTAVVLLGQETHSDYEAAFDELWSVSSPYHQEKGIFGDIEHRNQNPRRSSAIHMRVAATRAGYVAQQIILYSGQGDWARMQEYIEYNINEGFETIYGTWKDWR
ncbi:MAG: type III-B CRISPR module RAMP protein Cmr1 [Anaerolineae bacterium]|nr:type III-B CRISPR module RAMP protein Cmr1 [Anaerolineae bacterium]